MTLDTFLFLILECTALLAVILLLCRFNLSFLYVFLGALQGFRLLTLASEIEGPWHARAAQPAAEVMLAVCFFAVLLVFISHGQEEARRAVFGLLWGTIGAVVALYSSPLVFHLNLSLSLVLLLVFIFVFEAILLVVIYSFFVSKVRRAWASIAMVASLALTAGLDVALLGALRVRIVASWPETLLTGLLPAAVAGVVLAISVRVPHLTEALSDDTREFNLLDFVTLRRRYDDFRNLAIRDYLTGLYNRRHFSETYPRELERSKRYQQPLSIAIVDIDHFKRVNDTWGHSAGDLVLKSVASALLKYSRDIDMVFRYGGEEFLILLPSTTKDGAQAAMEKLRHQIRNMDLREFGKQIDQITVSVGVANCPQESTDANTLIELADGRLYEAKKLGRDRVITGNEPLTPIEPPPSSRKSSAENPPDEPADRAVVRDRLV